MAKLIIISGLPGTGKSTLAKKMVENLEADCFFEADMYFTDAEGNYEFRVEAIKQAHDWCQNAVKLALSEGEDVIVSNTFTTQWEVDPYIGIAADYSARIEHIHLEKEYGSIHGVPEDAMERMRSRQVKLKFD